jgi:hypothetical protein
VLLAFAINELPFAAAWRPWKSPVGGTACGGRWDNAAVRTGAAGGRPGARPRDKERWRVSPAVKLCGFLVALVVVFATAYAAGARLGPLTTSQTQQGNGGSMHMGGTRP